MARAIANLRRWFFSIHAAFLQVLSGYALCVAWPGKSTARLWLNDSAANSQFGATIGGSSHAYDPLTGLTLGTSVGAGSKATIDVAAGSPCSTFKPFGTWAITP